MNEPAAPSAVSETPAPSALKCPSCGEPVGRRRELVRGLWRRAGGDRGGERDARRGRAARPAPAAPSPAAACHECGGVVATDGYCTECGAKARSLRDHFTEQPATWVAAVCDRGVRHHRNEDAVALHARVDPGSHAVLVVCDGVSSSTDSDVAALAAARAARDVLAGSTSGGIGTAAARVAATAQALDAAAQAANDAVVLHTAAGSPNPASCTFVAGVVQDSLLVVGWVGDSRAYWLPDIGDQFLLTTDDSYAAEQIAAGVSRAEAESGPQAHAITRWLGSDTPDHTPQTISRDLTGPGWVLVCSDGLWNYCSEADALGALVRELGGAPTADPLPVAGALVDWANAQGGIDNITVALARIDPPDPTHPPTAASTAQPREEVTRDGNVLS